MTDDARAAQMLAEEKPIFRDAEAAATRAHFERLRAGGDAAETSTLHLDLLRDMKLVNSHIVAAAAYPVLERAGKLLASRISIEAMME
jgi:phosphate:Na+ symporter